MKTKNKIVFYSLMMLFLIPSCTDDSGSNPAFGEKDVPVIYMNWNPTMAFRVGDVISFTPQISPSDGAAYKWTLNGEIISTEKDLSYPLTEFLVDAELKFEVNRNGVVNSRVTSILSLKDYEPKPAGSKKAVAWLTKDGQFSDIPWESISHLILSSVTVNADGTLNADFGDLSIPDIITYAHNFGVQVMIEFSGVTVYLNAMHSYGSLTFYSAAVSAGREALVNALVQFMKNNRFDGINVYMDKADDGVYPDPATLKDFYEKLGTAVKASQNTIDGTLYDYVLSMSVYSGWTNASLSTIVNVPAYDWINVLAFAAEDLTPTAHSASWYFYDQITQWLNWYGVAPSRIIGVVPAFGLRYFGNPADYTWGNLWQYTEYIPYRTLCNTYSNAPDANQQAVDNGIFYDGFPAVTEKVQWALSNNLAGVGLWSLESDSKDAAKSLMKKINALLGN